MHLIYAFNPSKVHTHSSAHTQTVNTHSEPFMLRRPGSSWGGFGALLKGTSVGVLKGERALYIHSPHLQFLQYTYNSCRPKTQTRNLWMMSPTL